MEDMKPHDLEELAARLLAGDLSIDEFVGRMSRPAIADVGEAQVDLDRHRRCGFPEVVFAQGKTVAAMEKIFQALVEHGARRAGHADVGRAGGRIAGQVSGRPLQPGGPHVPHPAAEPATAADGQPTAGRVAIVTAGTSDLPVAEEARETALWTGAEVTLIQDVGVAGPHRLTANLPLLRGADAVVVVAGMEGALPSVVGGYVACPVIAVPTSVGYGASFGGVAALLGMLNSCASNVTVVNIDAGFKGGYVAGLIAKNAARARAAE